MSDIVYYKRRVTAVQAATLTSANVTELAQWCGGRAIEDYDALTRDGKQVGINVPTLDGVERASEGDYILKDEDGRFFVSPALLFQAEFERI